VQRLSFVLGGEVSGGEEEVPVKGPRSIVAAVMAMGLLGSSSAAVAAQAEAPATSPVEFTGHIECGPDLGPNQWQQTATNSEPRLGGAYFYSEAYGDDPASAATSGTLRIENDDGAWQGSMVYAYLSDGTMTTGTTELIGEGAYEGLRAIWEERFLSPRCAAEVRGLLITGDLPTAPEPYRAE
jgi:hypothetical protein